MAPSQCSSALPSLKRHMSNHDVVYFFEGSRGLVNSRGVTTITKSPSATTATILVFVRCSGTGDGLRIDSKNFTTPARPERDIRIVLMVCLCQPLIGLVPVIRLQQVLHDVIGGLLVGVQPRVFAGEESVSLCARHANHRLLGNRGHRDKRDRERH